MIRQSHASSREVIVADAIRDIVAELRLVDAADYIAFIRLEHFACISDWWIPLPSCSSCRAL